MLMTTHAETVEANKSNWLRSATVHAPSCAVPDPAIPDPAIPFPSSVLQTIPPPSQLDRSMYPKVRFWTKQEWKDYENNHKDSSNLVATSGARGGTRAALGENVRVRYVEHFDGRMVSGGLATEIRDHARKIWRGFWSRGLAPRTWGAATQEVQDSFVHSMEERFSVLKFCDNHWKAQAIATANYSQWHKAWKAKMEAEAKASHKRNRDESDDGSCIEPVTKKSKAVIQVDALNTTDSDVEAGQAEEDHPKIATEVIDDPRPSQQEAQQPQVASRPKARPLTDPLCDEWSLYLVRIRLTVFHPAQTSLTDGMRLGHHALRST